MGLKNKKAETIQEIVKKKKMNELKLKKKRRNLPGGPVVKTLHFDEEFDPWSGN